MTSLPVFFTLNATLPEGALSLVSRQASSEDSTVMLPELPLEDEGSLDSVRLHADDVASRAAVQAAVSSRFTVVEPFGQEIFAGWAADLVGAGPRVLRILRRNRVIVGTR